MTYETAIASLNNRKWTRFSNYVYLQKWRDAVLVRFGSTYKYSRIIAAIYKDGKFKLKLQYFYPADRDKLNWFMPGSLKLFTVRFGVFIGKTTDDSRMIFDGSSPFNPPRWPPGKEWLVIDRGNIRNQLGISYEKHYKAMRNRDYVNYKPRRRGRYWTRRARGVYRNLCGKNIPDCKLRQVWPRPTTPRVFECGCEVYTRVAKSRDTIESIMKEANATVRTAKIRIYGIEKFFKDANAKTIGKEAGYELLELDTGNADRVPRSRWDRAVNTNLVIKALRMECPSTGQTYINTVPANVVTVRQGLDWMYNTRDYLETVGKQT